MRVLARGTGKEESKDGALGESERKVKDLQALANEARDRRR